MNFHTMVLTIFNHSGQPLQKPATSSPTLDTVTRVHIRNLVFKVILAVGLLMANTVSLYAANNTLQFDGTTQYVDVGNSPNLQITGNLTIEAWIKPSSTGSTYTIVSKQSDSGSCFAPCYILYINQVTTNDQTINFESGGYRNLLTTTGVITWGTWQHVAIVVSGNTTGTIYLNGVPQTTTGSVDISSINTSSNLRIGYRNDNSFSFLGVMDEVRIWNTARTQAEIQNNQNILLSGTEPGLVAYYRFDEGSGTTATDLAGSDNTGTLVNSPTWTTPGAPFSQTITFGTLPAKTYGEAPFTLTATANSGLTVSYTTTGNCSVSGNTVTLTSIGTCDITAHQAGDGYYPMAADVTQTLTINPANQTITFSTLPTKTSGDAPFTLTATASSGLTVTYTATGNCTVSGNTVTLTGAGTCDLTAHQAGDANYLPAADVTQTLTINPVPPPIIPPPGPAWVANLTPYQDTGLGVRVTIEGTGQGRVVSTQGVAGQSIDCSSADQSTGCQASFVPATYVTLTPLPATNSAFSGWGGNEDCNKGSFLINGGVLCVAYFQSLTQSLTVAVKGRGKVMTENLKCPPTCQNDYPAETLVTLQARPTPSWKFTGWSGDCDSQGRVTLTAAKTCRATFLDDPNIPNQGDGNGDGIKDAEQENVVSLPDKVTGNYLTLEVDKGCTLDEMSTETMTTVTGYDKKYQFPQGLLYFDIACAKTKVTLYLHGIPKIIRRYVLQKYGPKIPSDMSTLGWYPIPNITFDTVKIGTQTVMRASYNLVDGEFGDNTGVDGHIVDPAGVAAVE